ncbi:MAG: hypothetical protein WBO45_12610, partial [Planctomycetota bacterium]
MRVLLCWLVAVVALAVPVAAQGGACEVLLRDGSVAVATSLVGAPDAGFELATANGRRQLAGSDVLAVFG